MPQYEAAHDPPAPVATVSLRATADGVTVPDVRLLIDTVADATLTLYVATWPISRVTPFPPARRPYRAVVAAEAGTMSRRRGDPCPTHRVYAPRRLHAPRPTRDSLEIQLPNSTIIRRIMGVILLVLGWASSLDTVVVNHPSPVWWAVFGAFTVAGMSYGITWTIDFVNGRQRQVERGGGSLVVTPSPVPSPLMLVLTVNPRYDDDLARLDRRWKLDAIISAETVVIVVGGSASCELLDRPIAYALQNEVNRRGNDQPFRRAVVMGYDYWTTESARAYFLRRPTIVIGSAAANPLTATVVEAWAARGNKPWSQHGGFGAIKIRDQAGGTGPRVAVWGDTATTTRSAVQGWADNPRGLTEFLRDHAGWR